VKDTINAIGTTELVHPIFYHCPIGLRFEIGNPLATIYTGNIPSTKYVKDALSKAIELYENTRFEFDILLWEVYSQDKANAPNQLQRFIELTQLTAPQEQKSERAYLDENMDDHTKKTSYYWDLQLQHLNVTGLFQEIITADLGGFAELASSVYLFDTKTNIIFHIYDDRGLDIVAQNKEALFHLYRDNNSWLLDYDRERINDMFAK